MTKDEALKLALEALELEDMACRYEKEPTPEHIAKAITAIKEALAQPEQEPVAYSYTSRITGAQGFSHHPMPRFVDSESWDIKPLYTSPPQRTWVGLTDEDFLEACQIAERGNYLVAFQRIQAKLKEKNT